MRQAPLGGTPMTTAYSLDGVADAFGHALRRSRRIPHLQHDERRDYPQSDKNSPGANRGQGDGEGKGAQAQDPSADDGLFHKFGSHEVSVLSQGNRGCSRVHRPRKSLRRRQSCRTTLSSQFCSANLGTPRRRLPASRAPQPRLALSALPAARTRSPSHPRRRRRTACR